MKYEDIQGVIIIYGTEYEIKKLLNTDLRLKAKDKNQKMKLIEVKNNSHSFFKDIKNFIWKGD